MTLNDLEQCISDSLRCYIFGRECKEGNIDNGAWFIWVTQSKCDKICKLSGFPGKKNNEKPNARLVSVWRDIIDFSKNQPLVVFHVAPHSPFSATPP